MKTLIPAAIRCSVIFTAVAALSLAYPASVQAIPTTYQYIGNHFTDVSGLYTTSDFVTAMVTLAGPLGANMPLTDVTSQVIAFTLSDGVQTITETESPPGFSSFVFSTDASGFITAWHLDVLDIIHPFASGIDTVFRGPATGTGSDAGNYGSFNNGFNMNSPGEWTVRPLVSDAGSTLTLMTLTLMALGLVARRFQRAAG